MTKEEMETYVLSLEEHHGTVFVVLDSWTHYHVPGEYFITYQEAQKYVDTERLKGNPYGGLWVRAEAWSNLFGTISWETDLS